MEGPRALRPDEFPALRALTDVVFRPRMPEQYPQLFNPENRENLRVCSEDDRCVSHVGMTQRGATLLGCAIQVCCIGAVATHPEYRGQGLASACFDDAVARAYRNGVDIMLVSGDRDLYRRRGCLRVGRDSAFTWTVNGPPENGLPGGGEEVTVMPMTEDELPLAQACYRREPVRFLRPPDDYRDALQSGYVMNRPSDFLVVRAGGDFRGYLVVQHPGADGKARIAEYAGDRHSLLAALPLVAGRYGLSALGWQVPRHDDLFRSLCERAGLAATPTPSSGTVKLIHFTQLMERMRPRFREILGEKEAARLSFAQQGETYVFRYGEDALRTDRDTATRLVFGSVEGTETQSGEGAVAQALRAILPLPCLWYGINYV